MPALNKLEEMLSLEQGVALCWMGNAGWLIRADGHFMAFDLDLNPGGMRVKEPPIPAEEVAPKLDVHFITHEHDDHFNAYTCAILAERSRCLFVLPANNLGKAARIGIPKARIHVARPGLAFDLEDVHVEPQRAIHGGRDFAVHTGANLQDCGYVLTIGGRKFLHPGDSVLLGDHLVLQGVNVLFVSPTAHNMHVDRSVILINALKPDHIFPQHYGTYRETEQNQHWTRGYPEELKAALPKPMQERFHQLEPGRVFVIR